MNSQTSDETSVTDKLTGAGKRPSVWTLLRPHLVKFVFGIAVTALFIYLISDQLDWLTVWEAIRGANPLWIILCAFPWLTSYAIRIVRWWWMLRVHVPDLPIRSCIWPYLVGAWLNLAVPFRAGDIARAFGFREQLKSPATRVLGTLVLERVFDFLIVVLLFLIGLMGTTTAAVVPQTFVIIAACVAGTAICGLAFLLMGQDMIRLKIQSILTWRWLADRKFARQSTVWLDHFLDGISSIRKRSTLSCILAMTTTIWTLEISVYILVAKSLDLSNTILAPWFSFSTATLATTIPSAPGFVGTFDYFGALGAAAYGIDWSHATAFIILTHLVLLAPLLFIPVGYILGKGELPDFRLSHQSRGDIQQNDQDSPKS